MMRAGVPYSCRIGCVARVYSSSRSSRAPEPGSDGPDFSKFKNALRSSSISRSEGDAQIVLCENHYGPTPLSYVTRWKHMREESCSSTLAVARNGQLGHILMNFRRQSVSNELSMLTCVYVFSHGTFKQSCHLFPPSILSIDIVQDCLKPFQTTLVGRRGRRTPA